MAIEPRREDGVFLGMAMIAKDEEALVERCFASWWDAFDVAVLCDTGSSDGTIEAARKFAEDRGEPERLIVVEHEWAQDFSAARTDSYEALPDEVNWACWCDLDDVLENAPRMRDLAAQTPPGAAGFIFRYLYAFDPAGNCICELWRERLVRHGIGAHWELPIHEVLKVPGALVHSQEVVWHHRQDAERLERRDPERNYKILAADRQKSLDAAEPANPRTLAYLGTEALALGKAEESVGYFTEYLARPDAAWDEERCQVAHKLSIAHRTQQNWEEAEAAARQAIAERPDWADGYLDMAEIELHRENPNKAMRWLGVIDKLDPPQTLLIINPLEYTYQPMLMRSVALAKLGHGAEALELTHKALEMTPFRDDLRVQAAQLAAVVQAAEAEQHLLALRELLIRFDENAKARALMDCAPYICETAPAVHQAKLDQREMVLHAFEPEVYASYYRENPNEAPFERQEVPIGDAHKTFHRVDFLRAGLKEQVA